MAKKKEVETEQTAITDFAAQIAKEVEKEYGKGVCISGQDIIDRKVRVIPWCPSLDLILGGGVPQGTWVSVSGAPKGGKSSALFKLAVNAQRMGIMVYFLNVEARIKPKDLLLIEGLDPSPEKFRIFESTMEKTLSSQDYLHIAEKILKTHPGCLLIMDSISALADEKQLTDGFETEMRGKDYQTVGRFINNLGPFVNASKSIFAATVHKIANTGGGMGASSQERVCNRFKYQSDIRLELKYIEKWKSGENIIGLLQHWNCTSSALGRPYLEAETYLRYGIGIDDVYELFKYGESCGLLSKAGAWYELSFLEHYPELHAKLLEEKPSGKLQGGDSVCEFLRNNLPVLEVLKKEISLFTNDLVKTSGD